MGRTEFAGVVACQTGEAPCDSPETRLPLAFSLGHTTNCCAHAAHSPTDCPLTDRSMRPDYGEPGRVSLAQTDEKYALECLFVCDADGV